MSRNVKKIGRFTTYLFFLGATFIVTSVLDIFQGQQNSETGNVPTLTPQAHADWPSGDSGGLDTESSACSTSTASDTCSACASGGSDGGADGGADSDDDAGSDGGGTDGGADAGAD